MTPKPHSVQDDFDLVRQTVKSYGGKARRDALDRIEARLVALNVERLGLVEQLESAGIALDASLNNHAKDNAYLISLREEWKATAQKLEEQLDRAEEFIAHQGMEYRWVEWCGGVANPASEPPDGADLVREIRDERIDAILGDSNQDTERPS